MDKYIDIKLECNGKILEIGKDKLYKLINIEGISSSEYSVDIVNNAQFDGGTVKSKRVESRLITITAEYPSTEDTETRRQNLIRFFNPYLTGKLYVNYSGVKRVINYEVAGFKDSRENLYDPLKFIINLICPNPFFKDEREFSKNMAGKINSITVPFTIPASGMIMSAKVLRQEATIINNGDKETGLIISFIAKGEVRNPKIENLTTGKFLRIVVDLMPGDILTINTNKGNKMIELNGKNISQKMDRSSSFIDMQVGENILKYSADKGYTNLNVYPKWTAEFFGV
ncbi:phage distal tail protein [Clostridium sp. UBA7339]|uniref:phage distal tail protein n=1 Tax=Clostridium sp. UBA7339 TaxID=1946376 RepID=UPI0032165D22